MSHVAFDGMQLLEVSSTSHGPVRLIGAISLEPGDLGVRPWRLPFADLDLYDAGLVDRAAAPAGVRLSLRTDASRLVVRVLIGVGVSEPNASPVFDLTVDRRLAARRTLPAGRADVVLEFAGLDRYRGGAATGALPQLDLYLPHMAPVEIVAVGVPHGAMVERTPAGRPRWITYGSSITQSGGAPGPAETWPALVARRHDIELTCLGFGGQCHLDPLVGYVIRDEPADIISLCLGVNVWGRGSLDTRTFEPMVMGLIRTIRDRHLRTPLAVISPIHNRHGDDTPNAAGLTFAEIRRAIAEVVELMRRRCDEHIFLVDGRSLLGEADDAMLSDDVHPSAAGYRLIAERFSERVASRLGMPGGAEHVVAGDAALQDSTGGPTSP